MYVCIMYVPNTLGEQKKVCDLVSRVEKVAIWVLVTEPQSSARVASAFTTKQS